MSASSSAGLASRHSLVRAPSRLTSTVSGSHALAPYARVTAPWELLLPPWGFVLYGVLLFHPAGGQRLSLPLTPPHLIPHLSMRTPGTETPLWSSPRVHPLSWSSLPRPLY